MDGVRNELMELASPFIQLHYNKKQYFGYLTEYKIQKKNVKLKISRNGKTFYDYLSDPNDQRYMPYPIKAIFIKD